MGDSHGAEPSVGSGAHQGALGKPMSRLAIKHGTMSAMGHKRTSSHRVIRMSALPRKRTSGHRHHVRLVPEADPSAGRGNRDLLPKLPFVSITVK